MLARRAVTGKRGSQQGYLTYDSSKPRRETPHHPPNPTSGSALPLQYDFRGSSKPQTSRKAKPKPYSGTAVVSKKDGKGSKKNTTTTTTALLCCARAMQARASTLSVSSRVWLAKSRRRSDPSSRALLSPAMATSSASPTARHLKGRTQHHFATGEKNRKGHGKRDEERR